MVLPLYHDRYEVGVHGSVLPLVGIGVAPRVPVPPVISELEASYLNLRLRVSTGLRLMFLSLLWWLYHLLALLVRISLGVLVGLRNILSLFSIIVNKIELSLLWLIRLSFVQHPSVRERIRLSWFSASGTALAHGRIVFRLANTHRFYCKELLFFNGR